MFRPRKSLGQNFLRDENILRKIIENLHLQHGDIVVEIGPGQGALTKLLVQHPIKLIAVEIDERAIPFLEEQFGNTIELLHSDVLQINYREISRRHDKKLRIVGNIPYYLTSDILFSVLDSRTALYDATLMMQLEVGRRLIAKPKTKEYGVLSIFTQLYSECEQLFKVSRNVFYPKPRVDSAVMQLRIRESIPDIDEKIFKSLVRTVFSKRRKTLRNGLKYLGLQESFIEKLNFDLEQRPDALSVQDFIHLSKQLTGVL